MASRLQVIAAVLAIMTALILLGVEILKLNGKCRQEQASVELTVHGDVIFGNNISKSKIIIERPSRKEK